VTGFCGWGGDGGVHDEGVGEGAWSCDEGEGIWGGRRIGKLLLLFDSVREHSVITYGWVQQAWSVDLKLSLHKG
jgi:hypothetical protein